ncbi:glycosyltransferase family 9 protein [Actinacidiphila bryophytorum]|uniref:Glycosyltransferase family 9 (Heptosyltransferase) n=1 Tax=Actinacidiphila bryophytorum TaxID=1436133 RepID=A0A9W4H1R8_9ACTN|nr:glycosyltransferase family 9 protein [Actinacidiphila bryophytorum]MBM9435160.1 lipopolysaccharide heptosyltransferase family protein [Actinacidiphila bryophytorum]MBN6541541.1 lipopolysaccharide heptosyltransferase family protein [Actinacidiphila bryophytorum]CAG7643476.1 Glycosyltransferase family 9 (Heptosyltransferase) [Actinacidiphila bryophytorum]
MTATVTDGVRFRPGAEAFPESAVHSAPLGYDRQRLSAGAPLPLPASAELVYRLSQCDEVLVSFKEKLGDSLLALAAVAAVRDWFRARLHACPPFRVEGPYAALIARSGLVTGPPAGPPRGRFAVIGDLASVAHRQSDAHVSIVCDPAAPPCFASDARAFPDMPARLYLALERRLGVRLPSEAPFAPVLSTSPNRLVQQLGAAGWFDGLTVAGITATSWPERKDYTAERFVEVAARIADGGAAQVRLLLIGGSADGCVRIDASQAARGVRALRLDGVSADELADVFPHCDLVVGNDTGLTHLAALARNGEGGGPPVVGLYARHAHSKWRTGLPHHHAVATPFSEHMHQGDLCPVRDRIAPDKDGHLDAITPASLAQVCMDLLTGSGQ